MVLGSSDSPDLTCSLDYITKIVIYSMVEGAVGRGSGQLRRYHAGALSPLAPTPLHKIITCHSTSVPAPPSITRSQGLPVTRDESLSAAERPRHLGVRLVPLAVSLTVQMRQDRRPLTLEIVSSSARVAKPLSGGHRALVRACYSSLLRLA